MSFSNNGNYDRSSTPSQHGRSKLPNPFCPHEAPTLDKKLCIMFVYTFMTPILAAVAIVWIAWTIAQVLFHLAFKN